MKYVSPVLGSLLISFITACSGQGDYSGQKGESDKGLNTSETTDYKIAEGLYTDQRVPDDFYHNELPDDNVFYVTYHIKNTDLVPTYDRPGMAVYELSTDDYSQALNWSETAAAFRPVYKPLVDSSETGLYFQFTRVDPDNPLFIDLVRVFKSSALDRSGVDRTNPDEHYQGKINLDMLSMKFSKTVDEYIWTFSFDNNYGTLVIASNISDYESEYVHIIREARLADGTEDTCDTISIHNLVYDIDKSTGKIYKEDNFIRKFYAKRIDNGYSYGYELCTS
jgi:hypothetical protein